MNDVVTDFREGVYQQARSAGHDHITADAIAAQAVIDRVTSSPAGFAVGQSEDFIPQETRELRFEITSYHVDQSEGGGVIVDAVLLDTTDDEILQSFDPAVFPIYAQMINAGLVQGYIDDHGDFRTTQDRDPSKSVTEWVKARVELGKLFISTKLKAGYEWVADKFKAVSIEAIVPKKQTRIAGNRRQYAGGVVKGFAFTNKPKNKDHKVVRVKK